MRTLDEVIDKLIECHTRWCRWSETSDIVERDAVEEAIRYLKEYKANREDPDGDHQQLKKAQKLLWEFYQNDPLSWDELKTMEGKPVWVESSDSFNRRRWMFVGEWFDDDEMRLFDMGYDYPDYVSKNGYESGTWQAYRKERE